MAMAQRGILSTCKTCYIAEIPQVLVEFVGIIGNVGCPFAYALSTYSQPLCLGIGGLTSSPQIGTPKGVPRSDTLCFCVWILKVYSSLEPIFLRSL